MSAKCCVTAGPMGMVSCVQPMHSISLSALPLVRVPVPKPGMVMPMIPL